MHMLQKNSRISKKIRKTIEDLDKVLPLLSRRRHFYKKAKRKDVGSYELCQSDSTDYSEYAVIFETPCFDNHSTPDFQRVVCQGSHQWPHGAHQVCNSNVH